MHHQGLSEKEVLESRRVNGENVLTPPKRTSMWRLYLEKFNDPVIKVLLFAAILSLGISIFENEYAETIGIFCAVFLSTGIGFYFEYDAEKKFNVLNQIGNETSVRVIREGAVHQIPKSEVVVGDIVMLETGEEVPADGELLEAVSLQVNESSLTGELSADKFVDGNASDESTYKPNEVMRGSTVLDGHGVMKVLHVGDDTEIGDVSRQSIEKNQIKTPLSMQLEKLAKWIGRVGFSVSILAFVGLTIHFLLNYQPSSPEHYDYVYVFQKILSYFMMAVTLIVVVVPEGLPMSVALSLALNMRRMLSTNNLVRKMHACETMGAVTVICTDKTGTLTQNQMRVNDVYFPEIDNEDGKQLVYEALSINSTAFLEKNEDSVAGVGNPTEVALLLWLKSQNQDYLTFRSKDKIIDQLPFTTELKYMATLTKSQVSGKSVIFAKGAFEMLMPYCISDEKEQINQWLLDHQKKAMRTLSFMYRVLSDDEAGLSCKELIEKGNLTYMGVVSISDPIRDEVPGAVDSCRDAGIQVKIVTGDTIGTAREIARQIHLCDGSDESQFITGVEFGQLSDEEALDRITNLRVMARARPSDKKRLVQLLQKQGEVVAVTGDGTNDAPALNYAHVGLSMGSGTSVAKEASDITLMDDSFASIGTAVMWGRSLYKNIQRFILFQLTVNFVALLIVLVGSFVGTNVASADGDLPLTVTQMLWVNLIMDTFAAMALSTISPSVEVMKEKPRANDSFIISHSMLINIVVTGMIFTITLLGVLLYFKEIHGAPTEKDLTIFFTVFVIMQFWNLFNAALFDTRKFISSAIKGNKGLLLVSLIILAGQILIVQFGGKVFRTVPLSLEEWIKIILCTSVVLWIGEIIRGIKKLLYHDKKR